MKRKIGLISATALVIGNMVGSGVLLLPASLAAFGTASLFGWVVSAFGAVSLALIFARLGHKYPKEGGPYAYAHIAFGDFVGFQVAWSYWASIWISNGAIALGMVSYLSKLFPLLNTEPFYGLIIAIAGIWLLTWVNLMGIQIFKIVQLLTVSLKVFPLLLIGIVGLFYINPDHFYPLTIGVESSPLSAVNGAAAIALFAFIGLESATIPADHVENPRKIIPLATIIGTLLAAFIYISTNVVAIGILPIEHLARSTAPFADMAAIIFGHNFSLVIAVLGSIACFSTLNGWVLLQGQIPLAAAQDSLFPSFLKKLNTKGMPVNGIIFSSIITTFLLVISYGPGLIAQFTSIVTLTSLAVLLPFLCSSIAYIVLDYRENPLLSKIILLKRSILPFIGILYSAWAIYGVGYKIIFMGAILISCGIPIYFIGLKAKKKRTVALPLNIV